MTELAFFPRVCCSFGGHGCDFEGKTEFRCKRNSSEFRLKLKQSEAYSGQPAQPALRHPISQGVVKFSPSSSDPAFALFSPSGGVMFPVACPLPLSLRRPDPAF